MRGDRQLDRALSAGTDADEVMDALAATLARDGRAVALTGAGVSAASDIPTFRGDDGLWERYDPMEFGTLRAFRRDPEKVWSMLLELDAVLEAAEPNPAHQALAAMERMGALEAVITQNVDGLHQSAGSEQVVELHGSRRTLTCTDCGAGMHRDEVVADLEPGQVPSCPQCGRVPKPDVTLFGEDLPEGAMERARELVMSCDDLLVIGTSAEVEPAASLPRLARGTARVWQIDPEPTLRTDRTVALPSEEALPEIVRRLRDHGGRGGAGWIRQLFGLGGGS